MRAEQVCEYFGFKLEEKGEAVRISDSTTDKTLNDLLKIYNPALAYEETAQTTQPAVPEETTAPAETEEDFSPQYEDIGNRLIYFTFEDAPGERTAEILDLLKKYGVSATFFLTGAITDYPSEVSRMIAEGHSVGLHSMTCDNALFAGDFSSFTSELETENNILYRIIKRKTRLVRAPDGSHSDGFVISESEGRTLEELGYIVWDWNVYIPDGTDSDTAFISSSRSGKIYRSGDTLFIGRGGAQLARGYTALRDRLFGLRMRADNRGVERDQLHRGVLTANTRDNTSGEQKGG